MPPGVVSDSQAIRNVKTVLEAAGSSLDRVVKVTVLLARPERYKEMNEAYAEFFPGAKPARAIARLGVDIPGVLISVEAIATVERPVDETESSNSAVESDAYKAALRRWLQRARERESARSMDAARIGARAVGGSAEIWRALP
jgi:hypothetical protein